MKTVIVSAYFIIPSKQPHTFYIQQMQRWFRSVRCPVIFFTSPEIKSEILNFGYDLSHVHFEEMEYRDMNAWKLGDEFWLRQCDRDIEKYHTPELAAIWYEKREFVKKAFLVSDADVFIWCDAGCIRDDACERAMQSFGLRCANIDDDRIHVQSINELQYRPFYSFPDFKIASAITAGNRNAWIAYSILYDRIVQKYDEAGVSCNSDQNVTLTCIDTNNELFTLHTPSNHDIDRWFFFLNTL
jgi:hypothetical protein